MGRKELEEIRRFGFDWSERNESIAVMRENGATLKAIGLEFGLTSERVRQILLRRERLIRAVERK